MQSPFIPPPTIKKMQVHGISESELMEVFNKGEYKKNQAWNTDGRQKIQRI